MKYPKNEVIKLISEAVDELYEKDQDLIENQTNERSIAARLAGYLVPKFPNWDVDAEYNRDLDQVKKDSDGTQIYPDIIIHNRIKQGPENNLVAIQVKTEKNKEDRDIDRDKIRDMLKKYGYQIGLLIDITNDKGNFHIEEVVAIEDPNPE